MSLISNVTKCVPQFFFLVCSAASALVVFLLFVLEFDLDQFGLEKTNWAEILIVIYNTTLYFCKLKLTSF